MSAQPPDSLVRQTVLDGERLRRQRATDHQLIWLAGAIAVVVLGFTWLSSAAGWPWTVPAAVAAVALLGVGGYLLLAGRVSHTSDAMAEALDRDAALGGELRSAHWFAATETPNADPAWIRFHLDRAVAALSRVSWASVYPRPNLARQRGLAALVLLVGMGGAYLIGRPAPPLTAETVAELAARAADGVTPELAEELQELLENANPAALEQLDPATRAALDKLTKDIAKGDPKLTDLLKKLQEQSEKQKANAKNDPKETFADMDTAEPKDDGDKDREVREALDELAKQLNDPKAGEPQPNAQSESASKDGKAAAPSADAKAEAAGEMSVKMMREASADPPEASMAPGGGAQGGESRAGGGGNTGKPPNLAALDKALAMALRKELVEANADETGANVPKEDLRRKTERGTSVLGFTRVAPLATMDRSRAVPPPAVPDARRSLVQRYFIRR